MILKRAWRSYNDGKFIQRFNGPVALAVDCNRLKYAGGKMCVQASIFSVKAAP
jgi:hypothetical protein